MSVSKLWYEAKLQFNRSFPLYYHDFILALDVLFLLGYIDFEDGLLRRREVEQLSYRGYHA